jgi:signal transduction histidine kinase
MDGKRGISARTLILALVAVIIVPGILFTSLILYRYWESERSRYALEALTVARSAANAIDRDLNGLTTTLQTLSTSAYLADDDLPNFYRQAASVKDFIGINVLLRAPDGQQLVNTRGPFGTPLPKTLLPGEGDAVVLRKPTVTNVFVGAVAKRPLFAIVLPVFQEGSLKYLLSLSAETDRVLDVIKESIPASWVIGVGDRAGLYVARSDRQAEFTGKPAIRAFTDLARDKEGNFFGKSAFGDDVLVGYTYSPLSGWLIAANILKSQIEAPLRSALAWLIGAGLIALVLASALVVWLWRFFARPLSALVAASGDLSGGDDFRAVRTRLREFALLRDVLAESADQVRATNATLESMVAQRTAELTRTNAELSSQIVAREAAESQIRQMQKMEAIGQLTGGIAHDFNNMLAIVISSLDLLQRRLQQGRSDVQTYIDAALDGARRAASLTARLLAFSRQQPLSPDVIETNRIVSGMSELLRRTLGEDIRIEAVLAAGLWKTHIDPAQIENAIINLAVNARDAMPGGGRLTIETANAFLDEAYAAQHDMKSGQYVMLAITDTGVGMPAEVIDKVFEPFFTTKKPGMGTGLGLSQVYGFVKQSNGHIKIYSEPGQGTTVKVYLPRYYGPEPSGATLEPAKPVATALATECILVVEDEENVRSLVVDALSELGYTVLQAPEARTALDLIDANPQIDLLFTDIVMPETDGRRLADEATRRRPLLKVLYMTGFTRNAVVHNGMLDPGVNFIAKPFALDDLARKIRQVLDAKL